MTSRRLHSASLTSISFSSTPAGGGRMPRRSRDLLRAALRELVAASCLWALLPASAAAPAVPPFESVRSTHRPSDVSLFDRNGIRVQTVRIDMNERRLGWVKLQDMSPALLHAMVLSEDQNFYRHSGVDWSAVATSAWANLWNTRTRGASTLTMQLAGLLEAELARPVGGRSLAQKLSQAVLATRLDAQWSKSQILEAYLNRVTWRGEIVGIDALAQTLFGKFASGLDAYESAIAAALVRGPNASLAVVSQRACGVLSRQQLSCVGLESTVHLALTRSGGMPLGEQLAPHWARQVIATYSRAADLPAAEPAAQPAGKTAAGFTSSPRTSTSITTSASTLPSPTPSRIPTRIDTTLDAPLQRFAVAELRRHLSELTNRHVEDGAVLVLDNATGEVRAWVGSSGSLSSAGQVDNVMSRRQPGSTLKPFAYELAFEKRLVTPASLLDDSPAQLATGHGLYVPQNYDHDFKGWVSARTALGASLNVPAVRLGAMLGPDALFARLNAFGLQLAENGGYHGYALVLGSADVTLLALTNAYRALAQGGWYSAVRLQSGAAADKPSPPKPIRVAEAGAVHLVTDILTDNNARARTFGLDSALATRGFAAVKTGTSKDLRDNWCLGFTDRYTVGVWVGNASGAPMRSVSGVSGAAPVWQAIVRHLHEDEVSRPPKRPADVVEMPITFEAGREPERSELFIAGTEMMRLEGASQLGNRQRFGIASPREGSIFALDPDIPPAAQKVRFEGESGIWVLDGKRIGQGRSISWSPLPGRHEMVLKPSIGAGSHRIRFEVRSAAFRSAQR